MPVYNVSPRRSQNVELPGSVFRIDRSADEEPSTLPRRFSRGVFMPRIVSLIASATEIVHALGMGEYQVGRSHECDFPQSVQFLPVCTAPKFLVSGSSQEVDEK